MMKTFAHRVLAAALALTGTAGILTASASANDLIVKYDQSQLIRLPRPVADIIIGNASIADVTVKSSNLMIVTGKSFGVTNIIALDADKNIIQDQRIIVQRDEVATVNLHAGSSRRSYNCSPQCNPSITVGDDKEYINLVASTTSQKLRVSENGSTGDTAK